MSGRLCLGGDLGEACESVASETDAGGDVHFFGESELVVGTKANEAAFGGKPRDQAGRIAEGVAAERQHHAFGACLEFFHACFATRALECHDLQQVFYFSGQWTEAIDELGRHSFGFGVGSKSADAAVEAEADG